MTHDYLLVGGPRGGETYPCHAHRLVIPEMAHMPLRMHRPNEPMIPSGAWYRNHEYELRSVVCGPEHMNYTGTTPWVWGWHNEPYIGEFDHLPKPKYEDYYPPTPRESER
jgi:hypothetical protein